MLTITILFYGFEHSIYKFCHCMVPDCGSGKVISVKETITQLKVSENELVVILTLSTRQYVRDNHRINMMANGKTRIGKYYGITSKRAKSVNNDKTNPNIITIVTNILFSLFISREKKSVQCDRVTPHLRR